MTIDVDAVGRTAGPAQISWNSTDALLYALGVGAGQDDPAAELELTTENTEGRAQQILPTYAIVLSQKAGLRAGYGDVDTSKIVHAQQSLTLHQPLPVEGSVLLTQTITGIHDKGSGALVTTDTEGVDEKSGELLFTAGGGAFIRGEGGFGGDRGPSSSWNAPDRKPDHVVKTATRPDQTLLYRLSGDRNPLHSDPAFAARGGFDRPILHGLCTYGTTARVLLRALGVAPDRLASITGRFTRPVMPGETLTVSIWSEDDSHYFRTTDSEGNVLLDRGMATLREGDTV
ncbi:MaoC/PaaZ C-terminal domain-containing protein [Streptomyces sp. NPDC102360]|uniref:MaoC/PaaZ C-terminal domain-containing protein n=1 Tax=Streptomyces sp. NPDC102360 TaxID=3366160 RepID=UPI00381D9447